MESTVDSQMDYLYSDERGGYDDPDNPGSPQFPTFDSDGEDGARSPGAHDASVTAEETSVQAKMKQLEGATKRRVLRPQPKMDSDRLTGERGIATIPKVMSEVTFKGKGHEADDLALLMSTLEHWAHRLYPKLPFDDIIERIERLGSKKSVQTILNKIRLDMPLLDGDFTGQVEDSDSDDDMGTNPAQPRSSQPRSPQPTRDSDMEDDFDLEASLHLHAADKENLLDTSAATAKASPSPDKENLAEASAANANTSPSPIQISQSSLTSASQASAPGPSQVPPNSIVSDVEERIRRNRELALQKKREREAKVKVAASRPIVSIADGPEDNLEEQDLYEEEGM